MSAEKDLFVSASRAESVVGKASFRLPAFVILLESFLQGKGGLG